MMKDIILKYNVLLNTPFPDNYPANDDVSDIFLDLVEYDGYMAGLFEKVVSGKSYDHLLVTYDQDLENRIIKLINSKELDSMSKAALLEYHKYLLQIKDLVQDINN